MHQTEDVLNSSSLNTLTYCLSVNLSYIALLFLTNVIISKRHTVVVLVNITLWLWILLLLLKIGCSSAWIPLKIGKAGPHQDSSGSLLSTEVRDLTLSKVSKESRHSQGCFEEMVAPWAMRVTLGVRRMAEPCWKVPSKHDAGHLAFMSYLQLL